MVRRALRQTVESCSVKIVVVSWIGLCRELVAGTVGLDVQALAAGRSSEEVPGWAGRSERLLVVVELAGSCTGQHLY